MLRENAQHEILERSSHYASCLATAAAAAAWKYKANVIIMAHFSFMQIRPRLSIPSSGTAWVFGTAAPLLNHLMHEMPGETSPTHCKKGDQGSLHTGTITSTLQQKYRLPPDLA